MVRRGMERLPSLVSDIMSRPVVSIDSDAFVRDAAILMSSRHIGSIIITEGGQPTGIVTERDLVERVVAPCRDVRTTRMKEIMSSPLHTISPKLGILEAMRKMREHGISRLVVMEGGNMVGIVTVRDVIRAINIASLASFSTLLRRF
jgi:CBS domain-containing protein